MEKTQKRRQLSSKAKDNIAGYLFIAPSLIGFLVFTLFGVLFSIGISFTDWSLLRDFREANFVGIDNYVSMFTNKLDWMYLRASLINNAYLLLVVPVTIFLAAVLANLMNRSIYGKSVARAMFFMPYVTNIVAVATVWRAMFHSSKGPINMALMALGVPAANLPGWLSSSQWALPAVAIVLIWKDIGYDILMYSGALQGISKDYYESADIDGASAWTKFFRITLPLLQPTTFMLTILGIISSLQMWSFVQVIQPQQMGTSTLTLALYIYRSAFITKRTGYAAALSWLLCLIILVFTLIRWRSQKDYSNE